MLKGWAEQGGPERTKKEAVTLLANAGWKEAGPAIAITVRVWVFSAFYKSELAGQRDAAHELYNNAIDVMEWGCQKWPNIPKSDRGSVFERSFIRGVKRLKMLNMHKAITRGTANLPFSVQDLTELATSLIADVDSDSVPLELSLSSPGHCSAFWPYTKASATSILAWHSLTQGLKSTPGSKVRVQHYRQAAVLYHDAAQGYPIDDESHAYFLRMGLDCLCSADTPLSRVLPLCKHIRQAITKSQEIWQVSSASAMLSNFLKEVSKFELQQIRDIAEGKVTMESVVKLDPVSPPKFIRNGQPYVNVRSAT